ncbi:S-adenosyl-L-methionine-dependent methyltransferase [Trametes cingulata]|nr:S-adenosyl-L-methionine-dependent methyltransferase [Trametes cingulata]
MSSAPEQSHDFVQANMSFYDEQAEKIEQQHPYTRQLAVSTVDTIREIHPGLFNKDSTEVLDYACGIGMISEALHPYVKRIVGVDISKGSVDVYNRKAAEKGLSAQMHAIAGSLKGEPEELDGAKFDVVVCCGAYRHIPDIDAVTRALAFFLKPGGTLLVADLKPAPDGRMIFPQRQPDIVPHKYGLSDDAMRKAFEYAGLTDFEYRGVPVPEFMKQYGAAADLQSFIARGVKPV